MDIGISVLCTAPIACRHTVSGSISLPSPGFFSPFPHGTCPLSVIRLVFSLGGWSPQLPTRFHVPCGTQDTASVSATFRLRACHPLRMSFPEHSAMLQRSYLCGPTTPNLEYRIQKLGTEIRKKTYTYSLLLSFLYLYLCLSPVF